MTISIIIKRYMSIGKEKIALAVIQKIVFPELFKKRAENRVAERKK